MNQLFAPDISLPPSSWRDADQWHFDSFAMHLHEEHCTSCSAVHRHSSIYRMFIRQFPAATDRRLVLATSVNPALRLTVFTLPVSEVPLCHICATATNGTMTILVSSEAEWNYAQQREREARSASKKPPSPVVHKPLIALKDLL